MKKAKEMPQTRINKQRLRSTFEELVTIDSPSRHEGRVARYIESIFREELEASTHTDNSTGETGSDTGNLLVRLSGDPSRPPIFFNAHLDTVEPGMGIRPVFDGEAFRSSGDTILGADDKAAVAILIEVSRILRECNMNNPPLELVFTVCEEIGLLGAKALDTSRLESKAGYSLDSTDPDILFSQAPAAIRFRVNIKGRAAHAGINPEHGISAIRVAATAISMVPQGRIDHETTANIGIIHGGNATNIIPEDCTVEGEVRSHNEQSLKRIQDEILAGFHKATNQYKTENRWNNTPCPPFIQSLVENDYPLMSIPKEHPVIVTACNAARNLGRNLQVDRTGGGSDANILNGKGIATAILGIGMQRVHTTEEFIRLEDMIASAELVLEIIRCWK